VFHPTVEDVLEFYEMREALESLAVAHAIPHLSKEVARELGSMIERMRRTEDARRWLKLNDDFHLRLYGCAGRPRLSGLIDNLRDASAPYIYMFVASRPLSERSNEEHQEILDACISGDAATAQQAIQQHLRSAAKQLAEFLSARGEDAEAMP
jgi:DNA-binding GntR family transcriptional regulator